MKINKLGTGGPPLISDRESGSKPEKTGASFSSDLWRTQDDQSQERLQQLLDQITAQGKKLGQMPTYTELKTYRELVRNFLGEAVGRMYTLQSRSGWDRQGRQKMYTTIKNIDSTLSALTEDVRQGQDRQLEIMDKLDAIRGMLVDLYT